MKNIFLKRLLIVCGGIAVCSLIIAVGLYTAAWFIFVNRAQESIYAFWQSAETESNLTITGKAPYIKGFPSVPHASFSGKIEKANDFSIDIPEMTYAGFPAPTQLQVIDFPKGFTLSSRYIAQTVELTNAKIEIVLPDKLPKSLGATDLKTWQEDNQYFYIHNLDVTTSKNIHLSGEGPLSLDHNLQISGRIDAKVVGLDKLLDDLSVTASEDKKRNLDMAIKFLKMMTKTDPQTQQTYFEITLRVQDGSIYFGPLRIGEFAKFNWDVKADLPQRLKAE